MLYSWIHVTFYYRCDQGPYYHVLNLFYCEETCHSVVIITVFVIQNNTEWKHIKPSFDLKLRANTEDIFRI